MQTASALFLALGHKKMLRLGVPEKLCLEYPELQLRASFTRLIGNLKMKRDVPYIEILKARNIGYCFIFRSSSCRCCDPEIEEIY